MAGPFRRIQKTGGSTYIVSLPKAWVEARLKKGDAVQVSEFGNDLVISADLKQRRDELCRIPFEKNTSKTVRRVIAHYLDGADKFLIQAPPEARPAVQEELKAKVPGLEVLEETDDGVLMHNLLAQTGLSFHATLRRLHSLATAMLDALYKNLEDNKARGLDGLEREADRFYILAFRQLAHLRQTDADIREHAVFYVIVIKSLEKIADHAFIFSKQPLPKDAARRKVLHAQVHAVREAYVAVLQALLKKDGSMAEAALDRIGEIRPGLVGNDFLSYNLLRILDYSADIGEMVLDMYSPDFGR